MFSDPISLADFLADIRRLDGEGEFFRAYDLALQGLQHYPGDTRLAHRAVLNLCNAGALALARRKYDEYRLDQQEDGECLALAGRLCKSEALCARGERRQALLQAAAGHYAKAYRCAQSADPAHSYYPGINLATVSLLAGDIESAQRVAREVLALVEPALMEADAGQRADAYWLHATAIEALVILGEFARARGRFAAALLASGERHSDVASTVRQLRILQAARDLPETLLDGFAPPTVLHYAGHMIASPGQRGRIAAEREAELAAAIAGELDRFRIGSAYGALAAGADVLFAEALLARGIALNVVLPFAVEDFLALSVRPFGGDWEQRFHHCLERADSLRIATEGVHGGDDALLAYGSQLAMGLAVLGSRLLCAPVLQMAIWDGQAPRGAAGTAVDLAVWHSLGLPQAVIRCDNHPQPSLTALQAPPPSRSGRATRAMLFGDIHGFSKLGDAHIPAFAEHVLGTLGRVLHAHGQHLAFCSSWGDAIFAVFDTAHAAAHCALQLQQAMAGIDLAAAGLPTSLGLRIGGHLGPVHEVHDAVLQRRAYMGAHVIRAARIEPITPEGCVYVTENFAALLALESDQQFACDYVGVTEAAKQYGAMRMFLLRAADAVD